MGVLEFQVRPAFLVMGGYIYGWKKIEYIKVDARS